MGIFYRILFDARFDVVKIYPTKSTQKTSKIIQKKRNLARLVTCFENKQNKKLLKFTFRTILTVCTPQMQQIDVNVNIAVNVKSIYHH